LQSKKRGEGPNGDCKSGAVSGVGAFQFGLLLVRRFPTENSHRNVVCTPQIPFHLLSQIAERVKPPIIVKAFLIVSMASLDLAIMPRCSRTNELVFYMVLITEKIKRMNAFCFYKMREFCAVVGLDCLWSIAKEDNRISFFGFTSIVTQQKFL
jgi:hypothetical protein